MTPGPPRAPRMRRVGPPGGEPVVFAADEQALVPVDVARWQDLAQRVLAAEGVRGATELSVLFVDEATIAELNGRFMGVTGPTDVLAFPVDGAPPDPGRWPDGGGNGPTWIGPDPDEVPLLLGDVVICPVVAANQADAHAGDLSGELALLVVHGILHLLGHDHAEDGERAVMQARERALLADLYGDLPADPWAV